MKKKFNSVIRIVGLIAALALPPTSIYAQGWSDGAYTTVNNVYIYVSPDWSAGEVLVKFDEMINPDNCVDASWVYLPSNHPLFKETYSLLLAAKASNTKIQYLVDGCTGSSTQGKPKLRLVRVK